MRIAVLDSGQKIITNGLQLHFDAAQLRSYPGSGATWTDLVAARTATLSSTTDIVFNSSNGGSLQSTENLNRRILINNPPTDPISNLTLQAFFMYEGGQREGGGIFRSLNAASTNEIRFDNGFSGGRNISFITDGGGRMATWGSELVDNTWNFVSAKRDAVNFTMSINVNNGTPVTNTYASMSTITPNTMWMLSRNNDTSSGCLRGRIAIFLLYNRALSTTEEQQNFNAIRSRFAL